MSYYYGDDLEAVLKEARGNLDDIMSSLTLVGYEKISTALHNTVYLYIESALEEIQK